MSRQTRSAVVDLPLPLCPEGAACKRANPLHLSQFKHDAEPARSSSTSSTSATKMLTKRKARAAANDDDDEEDAAAAAANDDDAPVVVPTKRSARQLKIGETRAEALAAVAAREAVVGKWQKIDGCLILTHPECKPSDHIVAFDMDDTLIRTKSGRKFATSSADWVFWSDNVVRKCKELVSQGAKLVIFTNQAGIDGEHGYNSAKEAMITTKIEDILERSGLPFQVFVATREDLYRKPSPAMWQLLVKSYNGGVPPNLALCTFVGDAAGRAADESTGAKKDFASSDRKFALNCGLAFATPDAFFEGRDERSAFELGGFDPASVVEGAGEVCEGGAASLVSGSQELVLLVGWPASGKSTFARTHLVERGGYVWVNQDTLKTAAKCLSKVKEALDAGKSCVVDNTNPKAETRATYIREARARGVPVRCFRMTATRELAQHLNMFRERLDGIRHVPRIAYNIFNKNFQEPELSEGFTEIKRINFVLKHRDEKARKAFSLLA